MLILLLPLNDFLDDYVNSSGQIMNRDKSLFFLGKAASVHKHNIQAILDFIEGSFPFYYLGVPIDFGTWLEFSLRLSPRQSISYLF